MLTEKEFQYQTYLLPVSFTFCSIDLLQGILLFSLLGYQSSGMSVVQEDLKTQEKQKLREHTEDRKLLRRRRTDFKFGVDVTKKRKTKITTCNKTLRTQKWNNTNNLN